MIDREFDFLPSGMGYAKPKFKDSANNMRKIPNQKEVEKIIADLEKKIEELEKKDKEECDGKE